MPVRDSLESSRPRALRSPVPEVLGREPELGAIDELVELATRGPAALILDGEAGIGKTTLWRAGLDRGRSAGLRVLSASPSEAETGLAFASLADLLDPELSEILPTLPHPQRRALEVAVLLEDPADSPPPPRAIASAFLGALRAMTARGPIMLALDDVQWIDAPSAGVISFALRRLETEQIAVLLARRGKSSRHPLDLAGAPYADRVFTVRVGPVSSGAIHRLIRDRLALALPRPLLLRVHEAAGGNPFFALELARELRHVDAALALNPGEPLPVPDTLRALVRVRVSRLPGEVREALLAVASLSNPTLAVVEAALGPEAVAHLHTAADLEIVEIRGTRIQFTHPLIGSGVYKRAAPGERRRVHRLLAGHVPAAEERARQLALGADAPDEHVAAALDAAAAGSAARGAPQTASELSEWAWRLTPAESQAAHVRRSIAAGGYHLAAGDTARARSVFERALGETTDCALRARARHGLAWVALRETGWAEFTRLLASALEDTAEPAFRCRIELDLAGALLQSGELRRGFPHAGRATELARSLTRTDLLAEALSYQAMIEALAGNGTSVDLVREGLAAAAAVEQRGDRREFGDIAPEVGFGAVLKWGDDFAGAREVLDRLRVADEARHAYASLPPTLFHLAELESWAGRWDRAEELSDQCRELAEQTGIASFEPVALEVRALVHALRGQTEAARELGQAGLELCRQMANLRHRIRFHAVLGFNELGADDPGAAREHLASADELASVAGYGEPAVFRFEHDHVEALVELGELERAQALIEPLEEHARVLEGPWCRVMAARGRGLLSASQGDLEAAADHLERALAAHDRLDQPFERARTLLALGRVRRRARQRGAAREPLQQALALFDQLGSAPWAARAREDIRRLGGRRAAGARLTPAEERIAELVARGATNKEVAAQLFLAVKTVETQLTRIYAKLGVHSRTELAHRLGSGSEADEM